MAFVTEDGCGTHKDVDGGPTVLLSPVFSAAGDDALISFQYFFYCDDVGTPQGDALTVSISNDAGATWTTVQTITANTWTWSAISFMASSIVPPTATMRIRFSIEDQPENSLTEAAIDELRVDRLFCQSLLPGDLNGDGDIDLDDHALLVGCLTGPIGGVGPGCDPTDLDLDTDVDLRDFALLAQNFTGSP